MMNLKILHVILILDSVHGKAKKNRWNRHQTLNSFKLQQYKIPVHLIRYEDILQRPVETMTDLMKFIFNVESIQDTLLS
jgi:hypothetical protein